MEFIRRAKPGLVKILDSFSAAPEIRAVSPNTKMIGRAFLASQPIDGNPEQRARAWWDSQRNRILEYDAVDYWEGYNEPIIKTPELMNWYARFEAERVRLLAQNGRKACIANFSMGNPDLALWPNFYPAIDAAIRNGGILCLHENGKVLPLAITEAGIDGTQPIGWKNHATEDDYMDQLRWFDEIMKQDDYVLGATIFAIEIPGWGDFDIRPIIDRLADYVAVSRR